MASLEGSNKLELIRTLKDCEELELFEQRAIQAIIDYKWSTYCKRSYSLKLIIFSLFMVSFFTEVNSISLLHENDVRDKGILFWVNQSFLLCFEFILLAYQLLQIHLDRLDYFRRNWNKLELLGIICYFSATMSSIFQDKVTDLTKILYSISCVMMLPKLARYLRMYSALNKLIMIALQVFKDISHFCVLFLVCLLVFMQSFYTLEQDQLGFIGYAMSFLE